MEQDQMPVTSYTFNPNSIITANNLKGKLLGLEEKILELAKEINNEQKQVQKNGNTRDEVPLFIQHFVFQNNFPIISKFFHKQFQQDVIVIFPTHRTFPFYQLLPQ